MSDRRIPPDPLPVEPYFRALPGAEPFLREIAELPDEDAPRLVFADWLDDHGRTDLAERAEFIRLQCARAAREGPFPRYSLPSDRERALLAARGDEWRAGVTHADAAGFVRGMLEMLPVSRFVTNVDPGFDVRVTAIDTADLPLLASLPGCSRLARITSIVPGERWSRETVIALANCPHLGNLRHLLLGGTARRAVLDTALALPFLAGLQTLDLRRCGLGNRRLQAWVAAGLPPGLRHLGLAECGISEAAALADAVPAGLVTLDLSDNPIHDDGGLALANSPRLVGLRALYLNATRLGPAAMRVLADAVRRPALRVLTLPGHEVRCEAGIGLTRVRAWAASAAIARPDTLDLSGACLTASALAEVLAAPAFASVTTLILRHALVEPDAVSVLAESPALAHVRVLDLSRNGLHCEHVRLLADSPHAVGLRELDVSRNAIRLPGAKALATSTHLSGVGRLLLGHNREPALLVEHSPRFADRTGSPTPGVLRLSFDSPTADADVREIAASPLLADFHDLRMAGWNLGDAGFAVLMHAPVLVNLRRLCIDMAFNVGEAGLAALIASPSLAGLAELSIGATGVSGAVERVRARWPAVVDLAAQKR